MHEPFKIDGGFSRTHLKRAPSLARSGIATCCDTTSSGTILGVLPSDVLFHKEGRSHAPKLEGLHTVPLTSLVLGPFTSRAHLSLWLQSKNPALSNRRLLLHVPHLFPNSQIGTLLYINNLSAFISRTAHCFHSAWAAVSFYSSCFLNDSLLTADEK